MTAGFVALVEEFLFRGVLLGLAAKAFGRWPAAAGVSLAFAGVHFLRPGKQEDSVVEWWSGFAQIMGFVDAVPPPWLFCRALFLLLVAGLILAVATLWTRSLWLAIGLHGAGSFVSKLFNGWRDIG